MTNEAATSDVWTVGRILDWTTAHLKQHGSDTARLDAEILLAHARNCPRIQLYVHYNTPLSDDERARMRDFVKRRAQAEPVAYLVGHREFFSLDFCVTPDVLIPRPETETLVLELLTDLRKRFAAGNERAPRMLDVGTGSGCVAVAAAVNLPALHVTAVDISPAALRIAGENAARHNVADRIRLAESDLFAGFESGERFDVVASNPPYVADCEMATLPPDVRLHEPALALRAGLHGLDVITRLVAEVPPYLTEAGLLLVEISPEQAAAVIELVAATQAFEPARVIKDAAGKARVLAARRRG